MKKEYLLFLRILKSALSGKTYEENDTISDKELIFLFRLSETHHVFPMIFEAIQGTKCIAGVNQKNIAYLRHQVLINVSMHVQKTIEFQEFYEKLCKEGFHPCLVKGTICRNLYPNPDARISSDEDLWVSKDEFHDCHEFFLSEGFELSDPETNIKENHEVAYGKRGSNLYIELHKSLFPEGSEAYGNLNSFFENTRTQEIDIQETKYTTMNHTDHLFYLICHAFKHFLHSGFGIRQVCDIIMYANAYGSEIDWDKMLDQCREIRADLFTAAIFSIGQKYLIFDSDKAHLSNEWRSIQVDPDDMLIDLLDSGVYGDSDLSRKHSSNITLEAVIADKRGKRNKGSLLTSLFPNLKYMKKGYVYLRKYPFLLPFAWIQRIWKYRQETKQGTIDNNAAESMRIGKQRVELMKKYGIIK